MPATWLVGVLVLGSVLALFRVLPFLAKRGGDFANLHRGAAALVAGESAFARPELDYPPLVPVMLAPLGLLPLAEARMVWLGLSLAALVAALVVIWRVAGGDGAASCAIAAVLALDGSTLPNLALGQLHPLLLLLLALALLLHSARPRLAAAAVGLAAALKIWPGLLLLSWLPRLSWLPWRGSPGGNDTLRTWVSGALTWALLFILPWTALVVATPPPHLPLAHGYWLGTPALLNFSAPAAALRASYGWEPGAALPDDWVAGVSASWSLTRERQCISVFASLLVLATGLALLLLRVWRERWKAPAHSFAGAGGADVACALVALALVAAPISWYHYQLLQLPAFVLALAAALRARRWPAALAIAAGVLTLTRHELVVSAVRLFAPDPTTALYFAGFVMPLLGAAWFASRVLAIGRGDGGDRDNCGAASR